MQRTILASAVLALTLGCTPTATDSAADSGDTADSGATTTSTFCADQGLPVTPFVTEGSGTGFGDIVPDFTVNTLDGGTWTFSDAYTGCTAYVVFVHFPGRTDAVMSTAMDELITKAPENVEYLFLSDDDDKAERQRFMQGLKQEMNLSLRATLEGGDPRQTWRDRFHFITNRATNVDGLGAFIQHVVDLNGDPNARADLGDRGQAPVPLPVVFGIDRDQRYDAGGTLSPYVGSPGDQLGMAAYLPHFYNYRKALDTRFADTDGVTTVSVLDEVTTGRVFTLPAALPDEAGMADFDTLEFDVTIDCRLDNPFACSEWDRIAAIALCVDGEDCTERRELARWITPYWRRGRQRYVLDASPMLALLRDGGTKHLRIDLGPSWERATEWYANVTMRLSDQGGPRAVAAVPTFGGGNFDAAYNDRDAIAFTPPSGTSKTELVAIISGHGQTAGDNCAEWCDHRHTFSVDGSALETIRHEGGIGTGTGCAERADDGVIPGQWGNWAQSRAYWCPGMAVDPTILDVTSLVSPGTESSLTYEGTFGTGEPKGGNISMSSYMVFYEDP